MEFIFASILALAASSGQLIRIPFGNMGSINPLDITIIFFSIILSFKLKFKLKKPPTFILFFLLFTLTGFISLIISPLKLNISEFFNSLSYLIRLLFYIFLFLILNSGVFKKTFNFSTSTLLISSIALANAGILQLLLFPNLLFLTQNGWDPHFFRNVSTFLDPNFIGAFYVLSLIFILGYKTSRKLKVFLFALFFISLLTTFSRSSYLMFLISGITFSYFKKSLKMSITFLILFAFLFFGFQFYSTLVTTPRNISREQSASFRISSWQQGLSIFQKSPVFGVGYNSYHYALEKYKLGDNQFLKSHGSTSNDSSLLTILSTTGIVGFIFYICFLIYFFKSSFKGNNLLIVSAIPSLLIHSFFANSLFYPPIFLFLLLGYFIQASKK